MVVMVWRRRSKAVRISATADRSPLTAASAAACATLHTFDVACDWRLAAALTTSAGAVIQPTRQPGLAQVWATPLWLTQGPAGSGATAGDRAEGGPAVTQGGG